MKIELPAGVSRQIHVSRGRIVKGNGRCIIVETPDGRLYSSDVQISGPSRIAYSKKKIPGGANVWVETEAELTCHEVQYDDNFRVNDEN